MADLYIIGQFGSVADSSDVSIGSQVMHMLTAILVALVKPITELMSAPVDAVSDAMDYLTICFIGIPFITAYNVISAIFRGMGDSKSPMDKQNLFPSEMSIMEQGNLRY